ncbi:hypothetical protein Dsin_014837 [Dipteronia sinensis]|uniref:RNase H type-1 domain-containing protein n=1 Tax=Dipteronia sinensis TaxID=43782 RepID=A0AAE0EAP8_9ROSI|nr:hypothetical protein Dsin_014837 [Dipteronia sinensis]
MILIVLSFQWNMRISPLSVLLVPPLATIVANEGFQVPRNCAPKMFFHPISDPRTEIPVSNVFTSIQQDLRSLDSDVVHSSSGSDPILSMVSSTSLVASLGFTSLMVPTTSVAVAQQSWSVNACHWNKSDKGIPVSSSKPDLDRDDLATIVADRGFQDLGSLDSDVVHFSAGSDPVLSMVSSTSLVASLGFTSLMVPTTSVVAAQDIENISPRPFQFQSLWLDHPDFMALVHRIWSSSFVDSSRVETEFSVVKDVIPSLVTDVENAFLISIPSTDDIYDTFFAMDAASAPGLTVFLEVRIVSPHQFGFIRNCHIEDCIALASECVNVMHKKCYRCNLAMKIYIRKAFDTLDWSFLRIALQAFGFSPVFMDWIDSNLGSSRLSVLINRSLESYFHCSRGVRQGDPLSLLLFVFDVNRLEIGCIRNCVDDLLILHRFDLCGRPARVPVIRSVIWSPPAPSWIKVNTDGAALSSLGVGGCRGVFRNCRAFMNGCFVVPLGQVFAFEAEILATSMAVNFAWQNGWHRIWLESDSSYVVQLLASRSEQVPWRIRQANDVSIRY